MKKTDKMSRAISQLEHIYNSLNADFFGGMLPVPIITVQSKPGTYGHCSVAKVWQRSEDHTYELNISAETLNYPIEEVLDTILHEMIHVFCRENGIKETSRNGMYHNGRFKAEAEKRGMTCYRTEKYGWNTKPNDFLVEYAMEKGWNEIRIGRNTMVPFSRLGVTGADNGSQQPEGGKRPSNSRKYVCPKCKQSIRATKQVNIICGDCLRRMIEA